MGGPKKFDFPTESEKVGFSAGGRGVAREVPDARGLPASWAQGRKNTERETWNRGTGDRPLNAT